MSRMRKIILSLCLIPWLAAADEKVAVQKLGEDLFVIAGAGGNIAVQVGPEATYLVDDGLQPLGAAIKAELAKISQQPVRFVLNTHWHNDHTGSNQLFGAAGAVLVAHDNVRKRMSTEQFIALFKKKVPAAPPVALPVITFAEGVTFHLNGGDIEVAHVEPAHTDGDSIVWFTKEDVVHMGDTFMTAGSYPFADVGSGGSLVGFVDAADKVLARARDTTRIIPGHGPVVVGKVKLKEWRDMVATIVARIRKGVAANQSLEQIKASGPTAEFDAAFGGGFIKPDALIDAAYLRLKKPSM
jgi:glyoxylase-like metal-dependent hydrolase (beta-lactamase superfamily II)